MEPNELGCDGVGWIQLIHDGIQWRILVSDYQLIKKYIQSLSWFCLSVCEPLSLSFGILIRTKCSFEMSELCFLTPLRPCRHWAHEPAPKLAEHSVFFPSLQSFLWCIEQSHVAPTSCTCLQEGPFPSSASMTGLSCFYSGCAGEYWGSTVK
jgi:hypothetical protein